MKLRPAVLAASASAPRRPRAGFSMAELLGVILVIGLISGIAVASWRTVLPRSQFNAEIRALNATLHSTRSEAIARNTEFTLQYDIDEDSYWVLTPYRLGGGAAETLEERSRVNERKLPENIDIVEVYIDEEPWVDGIVDVYFTPKGGASTHSVVLQDRTTEEYYTVEVIGLTGLIRLHEGRVIRQAPREGEFD